MRVYLDTWLLIYSVESPATIGASVREAIASTEAGARFAVSGLVWTECLVKPIKIADAELSRKYHEALAEFDCLPFAQDAFMFAAELRATHALRTPDALHVACAVVNGCDEFWTNDDRLTRLSGHIKPRRIG